MSSDRPTLGVGAICVHDGRLLMVCRGREPGLGLWSLPGGRVEQGERIADALRREVEEETGLRVRVGNMAGVFEVLGEQHFVVIDHFVEPDGGIEIRVGSDASQARWVPLDEIESLDCTPHLLEALREWQVLPGHS